MTAAATCPPTTTVADIDRDLAGHPEFGDGLAIERRSLGRLRSGLLMLGRRVPALAQVAPAIALDERALLAMLGDPVLRNAFECDLGQLARGRPSRATALAGFLPTVDLSTHGPCQGLADPPRSAWPANGPAWALTGIDESIGPIAGRLWQLLRAAFPGPDSIAPIRPLEPDLTALRRGAALLAELLPGVGGTALRHVRMVGLARDACDDAARDGAAGDGAGAGRPMRATSGDDGLPGAIFIAPDQLSPPRTVARLILREGLRLALLELVRCRPLVTAEPPPLAGLPVPWQAEPWPVDRALFALHRYVHQALFRAASPPPCAVNTPLARAGYLADRLGGSHRHHLTPLGQAFVQWLTGATAALRRVQPSPS
jgi:hypothetical protein